MGGYPIRKERNIMKKALYIVPTVYEIGGKIPMEYRLIQHKVDYRMNFCRDYCDYIIDPIFLCGLISDYKLRVIGDRVITSSYKVAYELHMAMKRR